MLESNIIELGKVGITVEKTPWSASTFYERLTMVHHKESGNTYVSVEDNVNRDPSKDDGSNWILASMNGMSIYELMVARGKYSGTEEQFLADYNKAVSDANDAASAAKLAGTAALAAADEANEATVQAAAATELCENATDAATTATTAANTAAANAASIKTALDNFIEQGGGATDAQVIKNTGDISQLALYINQLKTINYERENAPAYEVISNKANIQTGTLVKNTGTIPLILASDSSLTNRYDIGVGKSWVTTSIVNIIRTASSSGNAKLIAYGKVDVITDKLDKVESNIEDINKNIILFNGLNFNGTLPAFENITSKASIPAGAKIINRGIPLILASDSSLTNRYDISKNETWVSTFDVNVIRTSSTAGEYDMHTYPNVAKIVEEYGVFGSDNYGKNSISLDKVDFVMTKNLCNINDDKVAIGRYLTNSGTLSANDTYNTTGFIEVKPNTLYSVKSINSENEPRFICQYDKDKKIISYDSNKATITTGESVSFIRLTYYAYEWSKAQVTETEQPIYFTPYRIVLDGSKVGIDSDSLQDGSISKDKLAFNVDSETSFSAFRSNGEVLQNGRLTTKRVSISKDMTISARIHGNITRVNLGVSIGEFYGRYISLTPTSIEVRYGESSTLLTSFTHGLTLGDITTIIISHEIGTAKLQLFNDKGDVYECSFNWGVSSGDVILENKGSSAITAFLSFMPRDIKKSIWMFGDSYFSYNDNSRWLTYLFNYGYTSNLVNAMGGENSSQALGALKNLLTLGALPKYIVWCMGMNDRSDNNDSPNSTWLGNTQELLNICSQKGIIPILSTIPTVPERDHQKLSSWVRSSGYRYIDFAKSVEDDGTAYWKGWGTDKAMLSTDKVHPTSYGAKALLYRAMSDFPEITISE